MKSLVEQQKINFKHLAMRVFDADKLVLSQSTPYQVIAEFKQTRVRFYASENKRYREPLVFTAPLAINMDIYKIGARIVISLSLLLGGLFLFILQFVTTFYPLLINLFHVVLRRFNNTPNQKRFLCTVGVWLEFL